MSNSTSQLKIFYRGQPFHRSGQPKIFVLDEVVVDSKPRDVKTFSKKYKKNRKLEGRSTMMYRAVIMTAMAGAALGGAIAPQNEISSQQSRQLQLAAPLTNVEINHQNPVYPGPSQQKSGLPSPQFFYPTYPEYVPDPSSYAVQTGYDGYIIPAAPPRQTSSWSSSVLSTIVPLTSYALSYGARAGSYLWNLLLLLVIGGLFTTSICTFTPFCTITFLGFGINRNQVREQVSELARTYITPESMNAATLLVKRAIDKYAELQRQQREAEENEEKKEKRRKR